MIGVLLAPRISPETMGGYGLVLTQRVARNVRSRHAGMARERVSSGVVLFWCPLSRK